MRYLTKSRFKLATECPAKLFYTKKPEYADQKIDDPFLMALAEGGFQVGELAKAYFSDGVEVHELGYDESVERTNELLRTDRVTIFEAAIRFENLFIRVDILRKVGNRIELIEVKSKSYDKDNDEFFGKREGISAKWKPYLYDIAFQKYVVLQAFPGMEVSAFLMMTDKTATCPTDGLNQKIRIATDANGRKSAKLVAELSGAELDQRLLHQVNVDDECDRIFAGTDVKEPEPMSFADRIRFFSENYSLDQKIQMPPSSVCKSCEFRAAAKDLDNGFLDGFKECWKDQLGWNDADFGDPTVLEIWDYRGKDKMIEAGKIKLAQLTINDVGSKPSDKPGLSRNERQWMQVEKARSKDDSFYLDAEGLSREMEKWKFPLHFIDFETATPAIPFNAGRRPYEGIAFQFSHHVVEADGTIAHCGEYLNTEIGVFPNYDFVRALRSELSSDAGAIFRYAAHENTYLNLIYRQLKEDKSDIADRDELLAFIRSITKSGKESTEEWEGERSMVDLFELVRSFYYDPYTRGSNSIKQVLPAILNSSNYLQNKYSEPIYGSSSGIQSLNFSDWAWIRLENGKAADPYKLLPPMFQDVSDEDVVILSQSFELSDGGAAMTAYGRLQFEDMSDYERGEIRKALLKYCELDTLAMVMIYEGWREFLKG